MSRPKKIMFTINNLDTAGMKYVIYDIVQTINREKYTPIVNVNRITHTTLENKMRELCEITNVPLRISGSTFKTWLAKIRSSANGIRGQIDLAHSFDYCSEYTEGLIMSMARVPWIMEKTNLSWGFRRWFIRCFMAKKIVCLSQAQVKKMTFWRSKNVHIPTGVDLDRFKSAEPSLRQKYGLNKEDIVLTSVAHLIPVKGHRELIEAIRHIHKETPRLKILLLGTGEQVYENELKAKVKSYNLEHVIQFLGGTEDVAAILKMSDGKILATRNEGRRESYGAAIVEAMAAGLPVIATRSGGPEELVVEGKTGWLVDASGYEPLALAIEELYQNKEKRILYGQNGLARAEELFGKELMVNRYEELYNSLI